MTASKPNDHCGQEPSGESHRNVHADEEYQSLIRVEFDGYDCPTNLFVHFEIDDTGSWVKLTTESDNYTVPREKIAGISEEF